MLADRPIILGNVAFHHITEADTCQHISESQGRGQGGFMVTANLDHLLRCNRHPEYLALVRKADLVVADGMPLIWASHIQGTPLPERVAGSTLCLSLAKAISQSGRSIFLLGGNPGVAERAANVLAQRFPGLIVAGTYCPPFGFETNPNEIDRIQSMIRDAKPDVVYVALGSPKQEELIDRFRGEFPATWWMGIGISLSFITGEVRRAPRWMQASGTEWIHRLCQEPKRLGKRYLVDGVPFAMKLLALSLLKRIRLTRLRKSSQE